MSSSRGHFVCNDELGICCPADPAALYLTSQEKKPVEIHMFIDPLCPECWVLEPFVRKLQMEYSHYVTIKTFISHSGSNFQTSSDKEMERLFKEMAKSYNATACRTGMPCNGDVWHEQAIIMPYIANLGIKAAELQGKAIGSKFLRRVREALFLRKKNIADKNTLIDCAGFIDGMDVEEFKKDLDSESSKQALESDMRTTEEMNVNQLPALIFFGEDVDEPGLKVEGHYQYEVYVQIIEELAGKPLKKCPPIPLTDFISFYSIVSEKEISVLYDLSMDAVHKEMKKLKLRQMVEEIPTRQGYLWRYRQDEQKTSKSN